MITIGSTWQSHINARRVIVEQVTETSVKCRGMAGVSDYALKLEKRAFLIEFYCVDYGDESDNAALVSTLRKKIIAAKAQVAEWERVLSEIQSDHQGSKA